MEAIPIHDGMNLHVIPSEKFMTNILCVILRRPLTREEVTLNALIPPILIRGSESYPNQTQIQRVVEKMNGSLFDSQIIKKGEQQILQFYLECPGDEESLLSEGLSFLREIILNPLTESGGFDPRYTRSETAVLQNRIEGRVNHKSEYAKLKCIEALCSDEPFGLFGDGYAEDLPLVNPSESLRHYKKLVATSPVEFIALGKWQTDWLREKLTHLFDPYRDTIINIPAAEVRHAAPERKWIALEMGTTQGNLCMGLRSEINPIGDDYIPLQLANEILGGGANAKLFVHIREKESLCYSIHSLLYRFKSLLCIQAGVSPEMFQPVAEMAEAQLEAIKRGEISDDELQNAKQSLGKRWRSLQDNPAGCIDFYASQYLLGDGNTVEELAKKVYDTTREKVAEAACTLAVDTVVTLN